MVEARFRCSSKSRVAYEAGHQYSVLLYPVHDREGENAEFFEATPGGECRLDLLHESGYDAFAPGKVYRVTFEEMEGGARD